MFILSGSVPNHLRMYPAIRATGSLLYMMKSDSRVHLKIYLLKELEVQLINKMCTIIISFALGWEK